MTDKDLDAEETALGKAKRKFDQFLTIDGSGTLDDSTFALVRHGAARICVTRSWDDERDRTYLYFLVSHPTLIQPTIISWSTDGGENALHILSVIDESIKILAWLGEEILRDET